MDKKSGGFTLVELIVVIAILGIIAAVTVPRLIGFKSKAEESVCAANRKSVERMHSAFLVENEINHEDSVFNQLLIDNFDEICPAAGCISYVDEKVKCSMHKNKEQPPEKESPGEEVHWL